MTADNPIDDFDELFSCMMGDIDGATDAELDVNEEELPDIKVLLEENLQSLVLIYKESGRNSVDFAWMCGESLRKLLGFLMGQKEAKEAFKSIAEQLRERTNDVELTDAKLLAYIHLADSFPEMGDVSRLSQKLSVDSLLYISRFDSDMKRIFYSEKAYAEDWSHYKLQKAVRAKLFEEEYGEEA